MKRTREVDGGCPCLSAGNLPRRHHGFTVRVYTRMTFWDCGKYRRALLCARSSVLRITFSPGLRNKAIYTYFL